MHKNMIVFVFISCKYIRFGNIKLTSCCMVKCMPMCDMNLMPTVDANLMSTVDVTKTITFDLLLMVSWCQLLTSFWFQFNIIFPLGQHMKGVGIMWRIPCFLKLQLEMPRILKTKLTVHQSACLQVFVLDYMKV